MMASEVASNTLFLGTGRDAGADEDDFHTYKRNSTQLNKEEKGDQRRKRLQDVKVGAYTGTIKPYGQVPAHKSKVVNF